MNKKFLPGILLLFMFSCEKREDHVIQFSITNGSSTDIFVEFFTIAENDTENIMIISDEEFYIREVRLQYYETPNWYNDFDIHINSITNVSGDTLKFNPNISQYWVGGGNDIITYYSLYLKNSNF